MIAMATTIVARAAGATAGMTTTIAADF
jgi:hypothetical protein